MTEEVKKGPLQKLKESINDKEEQLAFISVVVRLVVVAWSGFIVSLNYVALPGYSNDQKHHFSSFTSNGSTCQFRFGGSKERGDGTYKPEDNH